MKDFRYLKDVTTLTLDGDACTGCGMCTKVCPHGVFAINAKKAEIVDLNGCMECGACSTNCPSKAIGVTPGVGCAAYIIQTWLEGVPIIGKAAGGCC